VRHSRADDSTETRLCWNEDDCSAMRRRVVPADAEAGEAQFPAGSRRGGGADRRAGSCPAPLRASGRGSRPGQRGRTLAATCPRSRAKSPGRWCPCAPGLCGAHGTRVGGQRAVRGRRSARAYLLPGPFSKKGSPRCPYAGAQRGGPRPPPGATLAFRARGGGASWSRAIGDREPSFATCRGPGARWIRPDLP